MHKKGTHLQTINWQSILDQLQILLKHQSCQFISVSFKLVKYILEYSWNTVKEILFFLYKKLGNHFLKASND